MSKAKLKLSGAPYRSLGAVADVAEGVDWVYQLGHLYQISAERFGLLANIRWGGVQAVDFEAGNDFVELSGDTLQPLRAFPLSRGGDYTDSNTGRQYQLSVYPVKGGFVPLGALRDDGSPHPAAGTGFGVCQAIGYDPDLQMMPQGRSERDYPNFLYFQQFRFDGQRFWATETRQVELNRLVPGGVVALTGMKSCIPDGDSLICAMAITEGRAPTGGAMDAVISYIGMVRWQYSAGRWDAVEVVPVSEPGPYFEPSLVRAGDGSLVATTRCRPDADICDNIRLWRSADGGKTWEIVLDVPDARASGPVSVQRAADGSLFVIGNPFRGKERSMFNRSAVSMWPVANDFKSLGEETAVWSEADLVTNETYERSWWCDHPTGGVVRDATGKWRALYTFRVLNRGEMNGSIPTTPHTGSWIGEVHTAGDVIPEWKF